MEGLSHLDYDFDDQEFGKGRTAFVTSPVRKAKKIPGLVDFLQDYKNGLEVGLGYKKVHVPLFDTPQDEKQFAEIGRKIDENFDLSEQITDFNTDMVINNDEFHFYFTPPDFSVGSYHDLGYYDTLIRINQRFIEQGHQDLLYVLEERGFNFDKKFFMINPPEKDEKKQKSYARLILKRAEKNTVEGENVLRHFADFLLDFHGL